ncbi:glycoside hydrolase family protein [Flavivirga amylovorans]|uniref:Glycoside hydrolase family protein n=1 Tax=Flavivirga amylovorans TaxID=870486 RepID=A0ABT8WX40_9FLAO|nr:glycoside hydrolase family protein [Flavivirga amylovorans]MDO5986187.1 glycoside hydrolase family protein [Flavivirga amylovorans]
MRNRILSIFTLCSLCFFLNIQAQEYQKKKRIQVVNREIPTEWENLIYGARFLDRFLPMSNLGEVSYNVWGTKKVIPRNINNGIEDPKWSYWGGNTKLYTDGKYHLFVCRWPENIKEGHMYWPNSTVVHAVSSNSEGPYKVVDEVGPGHNPEWYVTKTGKYVIYVIDKNKSPNYYISDNINGPWEYKQYDFDLRDRLADSKRKNFLHNLTFAKREDGSFLMLNRQGSSWFSKDGLSTWYRAMDDTSYPVFEGKYEDPFVWKTNIQYHAIVNDWKGRVAWHLRSKDGIKWVREDGEAYRPGIAKRFNGTKEEWFKYERIKLLQDKYGRAYQANFAVIDTLKHFDLGSDRHSSKLICIPMEKGKLVEVLNTVKIDSNTDEIKVLFKSEVGFDAINDVDFKSLVFGNADHVNYGKGARYKTHMIKGNDVIITFQGNHGLAQDNFSAKILGKTTKGQLLFAYARLPEVVYDGAILSPKLPNVISKNKIEIEVSNFGMAISEKANLKVFKSGTDFKELIGVVKIPKLKSFETKPLCIKTVSTVLDLKKYDFDVIINQGKADEQIFKAKNFSKKLTR